MRYLLALGIVTAQPTLHLRDSTLAGEAVQVGIELRMRILLALGIVTAQPTLHLRDSTLAGEAVFR
jgi:hypothetical protein